MNTKLHSSSSESQCVRVRSYVYISTVIREKSKMPCKKYFSSSENRKNILKQVPGGCRKLALQTQSIYAEGAHHTIFCHGPLVSSYATD
jgi:hypothetical protein